MEMHWNAEQTKPTFAAGKNINACPAGRGGQPQWPQEPQQPPPAYTLAVTLPDFAGGQYNGDPQYSAAVYHSGATSAAGFAQPVAPQSVQFNLIDAGPSPRPTIGVRLPPSVLSPPTYMGWSIFNLLCCFWPLGLMAIVYSVKVGSARNHNEAMRHSLTARNLNIAATTIAPILALIVVGIVFGITSGVLYQQSYYGPTYYSSGYAYYYTYLMYYTDYESYSYLLYSSYNGVLGSTYTYTAVGYRTVISSNYAVGSNYQYKADSYYG